MRVIRDYEERLIRLTSERIKHILEHPEMAGMMGKMEQTLLQPERVMQSMSDEAARLYYRYYFGTKVGDKYLCVVVKSKNKEAFVLTAYLTDTIKKGAMLWPKKS